MKTMIKKLLLILLVVALYFIYKNFIETKSECANLDLPVYNKNSIAEYKGADNNKPILLAFEGCVYDVSEGRERFYGPNMEYNYLTGTDATSELHIAGGGIIKAKYKIVGKYSK